MTIGTIVSFILLAIPFYLVFNVLMIGVMIYKQVTSNATRDWPTAPGRVTSSRLAYSSSTDKTDPFPFINYEYEVNGKTYQGYTVSPGLITTSGQGYSEKMVANYPRGKEILVFYNPKDASQCYLVKYSPTYSQDLALLIGGNVLLPIVVLLYKIFFVR